jgi:hypothetical protein
MTTATLNVFALFHLNLAFSSIEEEQRAQVVRDCYGPLLDVAEHHGPIGIEATAYTLYAIQKCAPRWLEKLGRLIGEGKIELIGSGYAQVIGPLVPADVVAANLRLGNQAYRDFFDLAPKVALVNEQAYSAGLVGHYLDAGYEALLASGPFVFMPAMPKFSAFAPAAIAPRKSTRVPANGIASLPLSVRWRR